ncbi:flippase-like domain-containing protein [Paraconexibacter antarcticus]|uniref:Flippase-like domain-containing protein n=1 Tax=Paraconexibacter antarcticus TaxID=2949664 RepID=A0ABY5DQ45_9ACTN|nr:lysylphosphatidylglycerol synthase transmembrane domain-containing protein [Paraconexibacter antarcticus]UTI64145.1 flippase-like domain-containing protein [Paraconexibacter antarcticus]
MLLPLASLGDDISGFTDSVGKFTHSLGEIHLVSLLIALVSFGVYLSLRSRAFFHVLRAAYPTERIAFRRIWGAYIAAYGFNNVVPARGGDVIKLFLTRTSIANASYPAVAAAFFVEAGFDLAMGLFILTFAFTQGVFPKPPDFSKLHAFDLSLLASHPRFTLFLLTFLAIAGLAGFAILSRRVRAFWARVRQGLTILWDRPRYFREVFLVQFLGWGFRFTAFWFMLDAFNVGGSVKNVLLVLGVNAVAAVVPFTPGGAGVQQAFLVKVFAGTASGATVAAYSVGQQIAIALFSLALGFFALVTIFKFRSFKEVIAAGRESRAAEKAGPAVVATPGAAADVVLHEQPAPRRRAAPTELFDDRDLDFEPVTRRPPPTRSRERRRRGRGR